MSHAPTCVDDHPHDEPGTVVNARSAAADPLATRPALTSPGTVTTGSGRAWQTGLGSLPEVRWAALATVLFAVALLLRAAALPGWLSGVVFAGCYLAGGWEPAVAGWQALRERTLDVDLLMIVAAIGAAAIGQVVDGGLLVVIFATSGAQEAYATKRTADSVNALLSLAPEQATVVTADGSERVVDTADLQVGDHILVRPGERVGADGTVTTGSSEVEQASVTGESLPLLREAGDEVFAGTLNTHGALRVRVDRPASESVVARIVALVEQASASKAKTQLFIEKIEQRYSVTVVLTTLLVFVVPLAFGATLRPTLLRAMTYMIVASPCAVVLATMPPLLSAIANAGRHGVLVKSAVVMEQLSRITLVAFDKTGTLTQGTPHVTAVHVLADLRQDELLRLAGSAERPSEHPLGRAITAATTARGLQLATATDFVAIPGRGITATVEGQRIQVTSPTGLSQPTHSQAALITQVEGNGSTAAVVLVDDRIVGVLALSDQLRPTAAATVTALRDLTGNAPVLLTGDNPRAANTLADQVGIHTVHASLLPADKASHVQQLRDSGQSVLVIGDGINDAPALATANLGVAMGRGGSDLTLQTADAVLVRDDLSTLPALLRLSRAARTAVLQNLVLAGLAIVGLVAWDLLGTLPLPLGVLGHEGGTVLIGLNGLRLLRNSAWRP
ncbi:MAG: ctpJ [Chthonomonadaceae bacterium]|nr:ctpJ [Chthonomonadaceae bacterium]